MVYDVKTNTNVDHVMVQTCPYVSNAFFSLTPMWSLETETNNLENMDEKLELVLKSTNAGPRLQEGFQDSFDASIKIDDNDALYSISGQSSDSSLPQLQRLIIKFHELNFFSLSSQSNIYGLTKMVCEGDTKLLIATLRGVIYRLSLERNSLQPTWKSVIFSYIPSNQNFNPMLSALYIKCV